MPEMKTLTIDDTTYEVVDEQARQDIEELQQSGGTAGEDGATFTPSVDSAGNLSWSNDKGLTNPATVNIRGPKGDDGYTPVKGTDYFDGEDGTDGDDGVSVTHSWSGTTLTVTSASGTSSADLKGDKGNKGDDGATPVRGTDYWTEADKAEIKSYVDEAILGGEW